MGRGADPLNYLLGNRSPLHEMKPPPKYSPVWAVSTVFTVLLFTAGLLTTRADPPGLRLTMMRAVGVLLGVWMLGQFRVKRSVTVLAWEVKGLNAIALAGLGAVLGGAAAYCLLTTIPRQ